MNLAIRIIALVAVAKAVELSQLQRPMTQAEAGAFDLYINTTSANNMLQTFVPILGYFMLNDHDFNVSYHSGGFFYKINIDDLHVDTVDFGDKIFEMEPGSDKLHLKMSGINASFHITGSVMLLDFIPLSFSAVNLTNISLEFKAVPVSGDDHVHWQLVESSSFSFGGISIKMANSFLQFLINKSAGLIVDMINAELPKLSKWIDAKVATLNTNIQKEGPYTFMVPAFGGLVNLTMTQSPDLSNHDLVRVYFDGLIARDNQSFASSSGLQTPPRLQHNNSEQFWFHERMVGSLINSMSDSIFPLTFSSDAIAAKIQDYFPTATGDLFVQLHAKTNSPYFIQLDSTRGVIVGETAQQSFTVKIVSNNSESTQVLASFDTELASDIDFKVDAFVVFAMVKDLKLHNTTGNSAPTSIVSDVLSIAATEFNDFMQDGWALANWNPRLGMLSGLLQQSMLTPAYFDHFMFGGFSLYADLPTSPMPEQ